MNTNCLLLKKYWMVLLIVLGFISQGLYAQGDDGWKPLMEINGFSYDKVDDDGTYRFYPLCKDSFCTGIQEKRYMYLWDFGHGRYSLEAMPMMQFDHDLPDKVTLRVTGLKEVKDPDAREPLYKPAETNCAITDSFVGRVEVQRATIAYPDQPKVTILQPSHAPVAGKCAHYLIKFDFAAACRHSGQFTLNGSIEGLDPEEVSVSSYMASPELKVEKTAAANLSITTEYKKATSLYLLLACKFGSQPVPNNILRWDLNGKFAVDRASKSCATVPVSQSHTDVFKGSLDPSFLVAGTSRQVSNGERFMWDIKIRNDGNSPETYIEVTDTLPKELDWSSFELHAVHWGGKDMNSHMVRDSANRVTHWTLSNDADPLEPGEYVLIQYYADVDYEFPCPDLPMAKGACIPMPWTGHPIIHNVWTMFHGEQIPGHALRLVKLEYNDVMVNCTMACPKKPGKFVPYQETAWSGWMIGLVIMGLGASVGAVLFVTVRVKKSRTLRT